MRIIHTPKRLRQPAPSECPFHKRREGLPSDIPPAIAELPCDERGYPVPYFVQWIDGKPDFRITDATRIRACKLAGLCWVCGKPLGETFSFVIGPMCAVNRTTAEPPSHHDCADWSARACPFLTKPQMKRREDEVSDENAGNVSGFAIRRNPGVTLVWATNHWEEFSDMRGGKLIKIGPPLGVKFYREGRIATRAEIIESIESGLPLLEAMCEQEATAHDRLEAHEELRAKTRLAFKLLPAA